jgi:hypothetical protein
VPPRITRAGNLAKEAERITKTGESPGWENGVYTLQYNIFFRLITGRNEEDADGAAYKL